MLCSWDVNSVYIYVKQPHGMFFIPDLLHYDNHVIRIGGKTLVNGRIIS